MSGTHTGSSGPGPDFAATRVARALTAGRAAEGFLDETEGMALSRVAAAAAGTGLGALVEIGAYRGRSTCFLAAGVLASGSRVPLFSVDHHRGSEEMQPGWEAHDPSLVDPATGRMDSLPAWRKTVEAAGIEDLAVAVVGDSAVVGTWWATPISLVFLDGGHGEAVAWADYRAWWPRVAPGGLLALHDVFPDPADGGRPPFECYQDALASGRFEEQQDAGVGSLRVLRRSPAPGL